VGYYCAAVFKEHTHTVTSVSFSPNGKILASMSDDDDCSVRLWNVEKADDSCLVNLSKHHEDIVDAYGATNSVVFSPDGLTLASTGDDRIVRLWNPFGHKRLKKEGKWDELFSPLE
jgi:WD40 repeat protein